MFNIVKTISDAKVTVTLVHGFFKGGNGEHLTSALKAHLDRLVSSDDYNVVIETQVVSDMLIDLDNAAEADHNEGPVLFKIEYPDNASVRFNDLVRGAINLANKRLDIEPAQEGELESADDTASMKQEDEGFFKRIVTRTKQVFYSKDVEDNKPLTVAKTENDGKKIRFDFKSLMDVASMPFVKVYRYAMMGWNKYVAPSLHALAYDKEGNARFPAVYDVVGWIANFIITAIVLALFVAFVVVFFKVLLFVALVTLFAEMISATIEWFKSRSDQTGAMAAA